MFSSALASSTKAQRNEILAPNIASLQVIANNDWMSLPVITLDNGEYVTIGFDELSHVVHRYCYKIEHCEADWTTSEELLRAISSTALPQATPSTMPNSPSTPTRSTLTMPLRCPTISARHGSAAITASRCTTRTTTASPCSRRVS